MAVTQPIKIPITAIDRTKQAFKSVARSLNNVRKALFNFKTGIAAALGAGGLGLLVKSSLDGIDKISKLSRTLGISVQDLRKLELAADLSGIELNTLARGVRTLNKGMVDFARDGTGEAVDAFEALNITADEINAVMGDQFKVLELVAQRLDQIENSAIRSSVAQELFGGRASELLLVLEDGGKELAKISKEAETFGLILSTQAAQGVEEANDAFTRLFSVFKGVTDTLTAALAPAFQKLADTVRETLINKITKDFGSVEEFGQAMAISIIDFLKGATSAFVEFANTIITHVNNLRRAFFNLEATFSDAISPSEYEARIDEILTIFENWRRQTEGSTIFFDNAFREMAGALLPLAEGAELTADELLALSGQLHQIAQEQGGMNVGTERLTLLLETLAAELQNSNGHFKEFGLITLDATKFFDNLVISLRKGRTELDETSNSAEKAKQGVLTLAQQTDILLSIPPKFEEVEESADKMAMTMKDVKLRGVNALEDALVNLSMRTTSVKEAFKDMARSIISDLIRLQIQKSITLPLAQSMGLTTGTGPSPRAMGGPVTAGKPYLVGEAGPELFVPGRTGGIVSNGKMNGGGVTINQTVQITTGVQQTVRAEVMNMLPDIANATKGAVLDARRRGGSFAAAFG